MNHYTVNSQFKAPHVERFNRTLREKLNRCFTYHGHKIWYNALQNIIDTYNRTKHIGIFMRTPISINKTNEMKLWEEQQQHQQQNSTGIVVKTLICWIMREFRASQPRHHLLKILTKSGVKKYSALSVWILAHYQPCKLLKIYNIM